MPRHVDLAAANAAQQAEITERRQAEAALRDSEKRDLIFTEDVGQMDRKEALSMRLPLEACVACRDVV